MSKAAEPAVILAGNLTIEGAEDIHRRLLEALDHAEQDSVCLVVDWSAAQSADITILQLLLGMHRDAAAAGLSMTLSACGGDVARTIADAGLSGHPLFQEQGRP